MNIQKGDVVLATWTNNLKTPWVFTSYPCLHSHVGRVKDVVDYWAETQGIRIHTGTSVLFEDGEQLPIDYCKTLLRPFKGDSK